MLRKTVLLTCGLSLFFSGFAFSAQSGPQEGSQSPMVENARKINPSAVEVLLGKDHRMTFDFYGDNIFRLFRDDSGGIIRDPKAEPEAKILVDQPQEARFQTGCRHRRGYGHDHHGKNQGGN